ncbi:MAG TPA: glycosyltransferase family 2 protein [Puia sp.]|nr:glycosyltransferase family 2 protein [Puia sp.]
MATPLISIVLPTYNGARYLKRSVDSCLEQTFWDFELIIVDDCSTDNTGAIADGYAKADPRIRVIHNGFNKKLPLSLNMGFEQARGAYHTWTSDDNYYAPAALEVLVRALTADPESDLVYADYYLVDDQDRVMGSRKFNNIYDGFTEWLGCGACFLYKSEIFIANNGYNPGAFLIEDYDFFMRAFLKFNFSYLPRYDLYYYREHESSLTSTQGDVVNDLQKIMIERQLSGLEKKLPRNQLMLLYRKFAVVNAVRKNNSRKYRLYLGKVWTLSRWQVLVVVFYVPMMKLKHTLGVSAAGLAALLGFPFSKKKKST